MKLLITGAAGQLGGELQRQLANGGSALGPLPEALRGAEVVAVDLPDADLSKLEPTRALLQKHRPDLVLHCAAFTNVDRCEIDTDVAFGANAIAPRNVAIACEEVGAALLHVSTDYVFSGEGDTPLSEAYPPDPKSAYGRTKLLGEQYVQNFCSRWFIMRTAWLYGVNGGNFVKTVARVAREKGSIRVVNDQLGNPTNAEDLAHHMLKVAASGQYGVYHCTGQGTCSWYDFAVEIVRLAGIKAEVACCTTAEYASATRRPAYSSLDNAMLRATVGDECRPWLQALTAYFAENKLEDLIGPVAPVSL